MFYVIGSEESKSGSASYSSRQQNQRRGGAVRYFRCTDTVSDEPTNYVSIWSNISIQLLCSGVPLCHYYTDTVLWRQACKAPHCIRNHRERKSTVTEKVLLLVRTFSEKYQRAKIILSNLGRIFKNHFRPSWLEVWNLTSVQLAEKSDCNFYSDCVEVKFASRQKDKALTFLRLVPLA